MTEPLRPGDAVQLGGVTHVARLVGNVRGRTACDELFGMVTHRVRFVFEHGPDIVHARREASTRPVDCLSCMTESPRRGLMLSRPTHNSFGSRVWLHPCPGGVTDCCPVGNPCRVHEDK